MYTEFGFGTATASMNHYFNEQAYPGLTTSMTNYFQVQMTPTYYRLGIKASGVQRRVRSTSCPPPPPPRSAPPPVTPGGSLSWPITVTVDPTGATRYGLMIEMQCPSG
jgi:hypothetical protein